MPWKHIIVTYQLEYHRLLILLHISGQLYQDMVVECPDCYLSYRSVMRVEKGPRSWPPLAVLPGEVKPNEEDDDSTLRPNLVAYQVIHNIYDVISLYDDVIVISR